LSVVRLASDSERDALLDGVFKGVPCSGDQKAELLAHLGGGHHDYVKVVLASSPEFGHALRDAVSRASAVRFVDNGRKTIYGNESECSSVALFDEYHMKTFWSYELYHSDSD